MGRHENMIVVRMRGTGRYLDTGAKPGHASINYRQLSSMIIISLQKMPSHYSAIITEADPGRSSSLFQHI